MEPSLLYEIIGYAASVLVAISLMMRSILKLRVINLAGSLFFTAYGLLIGAYPVAAVNFFIVIINLYYLRQMRTTQEYFRVLEVRSDSEYLQAFVDFYKDDIHTFQPGFHFKPEQDELALFIVRNMVPAGLLVGDMQPDGSLFIQLDYAIPGYRDLKTSRYVFQSQTSLLRERGIRKVFTQPGSASHDQYLRKIGFQEDTAPNGERMYSLNLT
jgi:hypothetical protein